jgi:hypothetical protein
MEFHTHIFSHFSRRCRSSCRTLQSSFVYMLLYSMQSSAKSRVLDETDAGRSLMNIKNRRGPNSYFVVLHWLMVVDLTFHHPVKPVEFCLTERILPISRFYLLFHISPFSSVVCYGALYRMPWKNPIWWGQSGYPNEDFLPAHVRVNNCVSQLRLARNPCWQSTRILCSSRWFKMFVTTICSRILQHIHVSDTGL